MSVQFKDKSFRNQVREHLREAGAAGAFTTLNPQLLATVESFVLSAELRGTSLEDVALLPALQDLSISGGSVRGLSALGRLPVLAELWFSHTRLENLAPLADLKTLHLLSFVGGGIADFSDLAGLSGLTDLRISDCPVEDLRFLAGYTTLEKLTVTGTEIYDISPLAGLHSLTELTLSDNPNLGNLRPLAGLHGLELLIFGEDGDRELSGHVLKAFLEKLSK